MILHNYEKNGYKMNVRLFTDDDSIPYFELLSSNPNIYLYSFDPQLDEDIQFNIQFTNNDIIQIENEIKELKEAIIYFKSIMLEYGAQC